MKNLPDRIYDFDKFRFDAVKLALYHDDRMIKNIGEKPLRVLAVLLENTKKLTTHEQIIERVWRDNPLGVNSVHIAQYISKLRKVFAEFAPEKELIETVKGRGYSFVAEVSLNEAGTIDEAEPSGEDAAPNEAAILTNPADERFEHAFILSSAERKNKKEGASSIFSKPGFVFPVLIPVFLLVFLGWTYMTENNEAEIRRVVKESQLYESLVVYKNPSSFNEESLDKYWTAELDINSNYDRQKIREAVRKMDADGRRYGDETRCEQFEFQSIEINRDENLAVVKTLEKWFIAVYFDDGTLQKNKTVGPYFVSYVLRKTDGKWLIEKSTTARVSRPKPLLSAIETVSEAQSRQQFFVKIAGQDFEPETVYIEINGEGCPESKPCKVPNDVLREHSKLTETALENVPLTLSSGEFRVITRNGDSPASNALQIKVP